MGFGSGSFDSVTLKILELAVSLAVGGFVFIFVLTMTLDAAGDELLIRTALEAELETDKGSVPLILTTLDAEEIDEGSDVTEVGRSDSPLIRTALVMTVVSRGALASVISPALFT